VAQGITTLVVGLDGEGPFEVEGFMVRFDESAPALNIAAYTGHSTIRRRVMGENFARRSTPEEVKQMEEFVEMGMREGAFGLSTSLASGASSSASADEILALARIVARYGGSLAFELRNEGEGILDAVKEVIEIGRQARTPIQISHLKLTSPSMWGKAAAVLAEIDKARTQGVDVAADINSYSEMPGEAAAEKDVRDFMRHAWVVVASDGRVGDSHPRGAGTFPRVLSQFVATEKVLTLETAIRKMSALPAARLGLKQRGILQKGAAADLVIFDPAKVRDLSNMQDPAALAEGMKYVFVNGVSVINDGLPTDSRPGSGLR
jgi:N-acyl-D-aspartate/D-glutamate deacylase